MPFLIRPGVVVKTPSRNLGALIREVWRLGVEHARQEHVTARGGFPGPDVIMTPAQLKAWKDEPFPELGSAEEQSDWKPGADEVTLEIIAIDGEQWDTYQSLLRDAREGKPVDRVIGLRRAYRHIVSAAVDNIEGFSDAQGPYVIARDSEGLLSREGVNTLERDGWLNHIAQVAATYQRLSDEEKGNFGGQRQPTLESRDTNVTAARSPVGNQKDATATPVPTFGVMLREDDTPPADARPVMS